MEYEIIEERKCGYLKIVLSDEKIITTNNRAWKKLTKQISTKFEQADFSSFMLEECECAEAKAKALRLLANRLYSAGEMQEKLISAGFSAKIVADCVRYLIDRQYLNDYEFAYSFIKNSLSAKSPTRIANDLSRKGISSQIIADLLGQEDVKVCSEAALEAY